MLHMPTKSGLLHGRESHGIVKASRPLGDALQRERRTHSRKRGRHRNSAGTLLPGSLAHSHLKMRCSQSATYTSASSTGTSISGPTVAASASEERKPKAPTATSNRQLEVVAARCERLRVAEHLTKLSCCA